MTEPSPPIRDALETVQPRWDAARTEHTLAGLPARRRHRRAVAAAGVGGVAVLVFAVLQIPATLLHDNGRAAAPSRVANVDPAQARLIELHDGSRVELSNAAARLEMQQSTTSLVALALHDGPARFLVSKRPSRRFRVQLGEVTVEVLGTTFRMEPHGSGAFVAVEEGRVQVRWTGGQRTLASGERGVFPPQAPAPDSDPEPEPAPESDALAARAAPAPGAWQKFAAQGQFSEAYALLQRPEARVDSRVEALLLAADSARLSGHPAQAVPFLRRVMDEHAADARAPLAAFTLGNVLLNQLGLPREAEAAYARARRDTRSAALSQDALARQVEAAHRAGDEELARRLAQQYVAEYPDGRRLHAVKRFGGL
jgi:transmembrane sensor